MPTEISVDEELRRRRGRPGHPLHPSDVRRHCVSVRLNQAELDLLDRSCGAHQMERGEFLRTVAFGNRVEPQRLAVPQLVVPQLNQELRGELGKALSNLNQIARQFNSGVKLPVDFVDAELRRLARLLIGASAALEEE